jgi:hypothetical protein
MASTDPFARFPPHRHLLNGRRHLILRIAVPFLTLQPPVLQNNRKVPEPSCNRRRPQPNLWQPSGINRPKACYLLNFAKNSLFSGEIRAETGSHMTAHTTIPGLLDPIFFQDPVFFQDSVHQLTA